MLNPKIDQLQEYNVEDIQSLSYVPSFAFKHKTDEYFFVSREVRDGSLNCQYIIGTKNGQYFTSFYDLNPLRKIYDRDDLSVDQKRQMILDKTQELNTFEKKCPSPSAKGSGPATDILSLLIWGPLIPVAVVTAPIINSFTNDHDIRSMNVKFPKLKLGSSLAEVRKAFAPLYLEEQKINGLVFYVQQVDWGTRTILFFENDQLSVVVRDFPTKAALSKAIKSK